MQVLDRSPKRRRQRLIVTGPARQAMADVCRHEGQQAVFLAWPTGAAYLPVAQYAPGEYDIVIGHIARCPIYADLRPLGWFAGRRVVLDIAEPPRPGRRPLLRLRSDGGRPFADVAVL